MSHVDNSKKFAPKQITDDGQVGGEGAALAHSTEYQAKTDGIITVCSVTTSSVSNTVAIRHGTVSGSLTDVQKIQLDDGAGDEFGSMSLPVSAGEYWLIYQSNTTDTTSTIIWRPIR